MGFFKIWYQNSQYRLQKAIILPPTSCLCVCNWSFYLCSCHNISTSLWVDIFRIFELNRKPLFLKSNVQIMPKCLMFIDTKVKLCKIFLKCASIIDVYIIINNYCMFINNYVKLYIIMKYIDLWLIWCVLTFFPWSGCKYNLVMSLKYFH